MAKSTIRTYLKYSVWPSYAFKIKAKYADTNGYCMCVTCSKQMHWRDPECQAGHAVGGRSMNILLDDELVFPQCYRCNHILHGNYWEYIQFFRRKGLSYEEIEKLYARKHVAKKYTMSELKEIKKENDAEAQIYIKEKGLC